MKVEELENITSEKKMKEFCDTYLNLNPSITLEQSILGVLTVKKCYELNYHKLFITFFSLPKILILYKMSGDNFLFQAYIYINNILYRYSESVKILNHINNLKILNEKSLFNLNVALTHEKEYSKILDLTKNSKNYKFLLQRALAFQYLNDLDNAYSICKKLRHLNIPQRENDLLNYRFAEIFYRRNQKELLRKQLLILPTAFETSIN